MTLDVHTNVSVRLPMYPCAFHNFWRPITDIETDLMMSDLQELQV